MSKELPSNKNTPEEVDLIVFFNLIGNVFTRFFNFIGSILKTIFSVIIYAIKTFVVNWKLIIGVLILAGAVGLFLEQRKPKVYSSEMLVKPYFDSKFQLATNIQYFNALIANEDYETLDGIFNGNNPDVKVDVKEIKSFKIETGPETENDKILQFQGFLQALDSTRIEIEEVSFEDYIDNRSIFSGDLFQITAESYNKRIFKDLEYGISTAFTNAFSNDKKEKEQKFYKLEKENLIASLEELERLQNIYIDVLQYEAKNPKKQIQLGDLSLSQDKSSTKEFDLLNKELVIRDKLRRLEEKNIQQDVFVDVISSFQKVGNRKIRLKERYSIIFPAVSFLLLCLIFLANKIVNYAINYEE